MTAMVNGDFDRAANGVPSSNGDGIVKKEEFDDDDDIPLAMKMKSKKPASSDDDDDIPLSAKYSKKRKHEDSTVAEPEKKKVKKDKHKKDKHKKEKYQKGKASVKTEAVSPTKKPAKKEVEDHVWKWWEEEKLEDGAKWRTLEHKGPVFAPPYEPLPSNIKFYYDGERLKLSEPTEEVAGFYAKMLDHEYTKKDAFNKNFMNDWVKVMTEEERKTIKKLSKCNFSEMHKYFMEQSEARKNMSKEEKQKIKEKNAEIQAEYGFCNMDGHKQKIANFRIEPPGLFRGRGNHPKMGMLKRRTRPEEVIINCSKGAKVPDPPAGHRWKEVRHDNAVSWLACWVENVQGNFKYIMLNASSRLKGEKDWKKYETARQLHKHVDKIRADYRADFKSKEMRVRQRAVALYFIDKLALRAGNEKDEDEADTVGCCSLRYEHTKLHEELNGKQFVVAFDFLGKDSIRYQNEVPVTKRVFKNLKLFMKNKQEGDDLFDRLNTTILNQYLRELMEGLTAKVFRTYNASKTLEEQLDLLTKPDDNLAAKILAYNRANRAVAVLCNHQRAVPKTFEKSMETLQGKIKAKRDQIKDAKKDAKRMKADYKKMKDPKVKAQYEKLKKRLQTLKDQETNLQVQATDRNENKDIALGTSKLNYLDPRISVAWCKKWNVPVEKIYNKTHREKFQWAVDMATKNFKFCDRDSDKDTNKLKASESGEEEEDDD